MSQPRTLRDVMDELAKARAQYKEAQDYARSVGGQIGSLREELEAMLRELGLKNASTEDGQLTAFFSKRVRANVFDPDDTKKWLEQNGMIVNDYFTPHSTRLASVAKSALKETGEIVPGIELLTDETLSLRDNSKKDDDGGEK